GADTLGERPLRIELKLQFAPEKKIGEELVLADIGRDHFFDLLRFQKNAERDAVNAGVVRNDGQVFRAEIAYSLDQFLRRAAEAEAARQHQHAVLHDVDEGGFGVWIDFIHG